MSVFSGKIFGSSSGTRVGHTKLGMELLCASGHLSCMKQGGAKKKERFPVGTSFGTTYDVKIIGNPMSIVNYQ